MIKLKRRMLYSAIPVLLAIVATCQAGNTFAQQIFFNAGGGAVQGKQMKAALEQELERIKTVHEQRLATCINDMKRVCALSDRQVTKLRVAAKGAIEISMKSVRKQYSERLQQFGMINPAVPINSDEESDDESEAIDDANVEEGIEEVEDEQQEAFRDLEILGIVRQNVEAMGGELAKPESARVWKNAISKTLTEEQAGAYDKALSAHMARWREAAVAAFVAKADTELLLQDSQREELFKLINDHYGAALRKDAARSFREALLLFDNRAESKIDNDVRKFLSDCQYQVWKSEFAVELEHIAARNGEVPRNKGGVFGGFFGN